MCINEALNFVYAYAKDKCSGRDLDIISKELLNLSEKQKFLFEETGCISNSYQTTQSMLSKLNERESIRKSKGVYYTPFDVVKFIVTNSLKLAFGKLTPENIGCDDLLGIPFRNFATQKTVFDPTCGAGEYLLATLEIKFSLLEQHYKKISKKIVDKTISTIFGNDINSESIVITKLRILLCVLERYGVKYCVGLSKILKNQFFTYDYVQESSRNKYYDIIVGNPPYVEDFKSGLSLERRYGNIYANVLMNAAKQLSSNGSLGFVIPLSYISTPRMAILREELVQYIPEQYIMSYSDRPDCLFDSVHQKLCIVIGKRCKKSKGIFTGNYQYWYKEERDSLFSRTKIVRNKYFYPTGIPKLGTEMDIDIFKKITNTNKMKSVYAESRKGDESVYLNRRETFWMKAYREKVNDPEYKIFSFQNKESADYCYCLINSSLFWWYWISVSDCWHVSKELNGFMAPFNGNYKKAVNLAMALREKLEETKVYVGTKQTDFEYKHKECIKEIHSIDLYVNRIFGLTKEESDYIMNFAFKYRTSGGVNKQ